MIARWSSIAVGWTWMPILPVTPCLIWIFFCWIKSLNSIHDFCSEITKDGTFWVLTAIGSILTGTEEVSRAQSVSISQIVLSVELQLIAAGGNRKSSEFRHYSEMISPSVEMPHFFFLLPSIVIVEVPCTGSLFVFTSWFCTLLFLFELLNPLLVSSLLNLTPCSIAILQTRNLKIERSHLYIIWVSTKSSTNGALCLGLGVLWRLCDELFS